jgi:hypothetical protein
MPLNYQHSTSLNYSLWKRSAQTRGVIGLGVISGATAYWPPSQSFHYVGGGGEVQARKSKGVSYGHRGGCLWVARDWYPGCKGHVLQLHQVASWRWSCWALI